MTGPVDERAGPRVPAGADASGIDVFISHVEEDGGVALQLADALEAAGYSTWCYERDTIPGPSYLLQTSGAIEASRAVVVLISADALGSHQVTSEVVRAHEEVKPFIPLLIGISREEFGVRQPEWREAIGSAATIELPDRGVAGIAPRIVDGLVALGVRPHEPGRPEQRPAYPGGSERPSGRPARGRRQLLVLALVAAAIVGLGAFLLIRLLGADDGETSRGAASSPPTATGTSGSSPSPAVSTSAAPSTVGKDAATTPVKTLGGLAKATARADTEFCPIGGGACETAPPGRVFLLLDLTPWKSGGLRFDEKVSMSAFGAHVTFEHLGFTPVETHSIQTGGAGFTVVFPSVPDTVVGADIELRWPNNGPLRVHVRP
jgi:hypothetical protein